MRQSLSPAARMAAICVALLTATQVQAQQVVSDIVVEPQLARNDVAGARFEPDFDPQPVYAGPFVLEPSLSLVTEYYSNVLNRDDAEGDAAAALSARLRARLNTPLHLLQVTGSGRLRRYLDLSSENTDEFAISSEGRYDLSEPNNLWFNAGFASLNESRSSAGSALGAVEPARYDQISGKLGAQLEFGALSLRPSASYSRSDYATLALAGGASQDQSFRDSEGYSGNLSVGYRISGPVYVFSTGSIGRSTSINAPANLARDADDFSVVGGIRGEISPTVTGEFAVGYREQDYDLGRFLDYGGATFSGDLQWYATPLTTFRLRASQQFLNSGIVDVAGILANEVTLTAYYDPLRNLRLSADLGYSHYQYREVDTEARRPSLRLQGQYRLSSRLSFGAYVSALRQDVSGPEIVEPFTAFSTGLGVTLTP